MSVAILKFKLPDEQADFTAAVRGRDYRRVLWDFDQNLRSNEKYTNDPARAALAAELREELWEMLRNEGITSEELGS